MDLQLIGKSALITGASKGIGRATAVVLAAEGCSLHLAARSGDALETLRNEILAKHAVKVDLHPGDLSTTIECYFALKLAGDHGPHLERARAFAASRGGIANARVFTRIWLALCGEWSWEELPAMPPELMLLPARAPLKKSAIRWILCPPMLRSTPPAYG